MSPWLRGYSTCFISKQSWVRVPSVAQRLIMSNNWAAQYILQLSQGQIVKFRPHGNSMQPRIESGQLVTLTPVTQENVIEVGNIVLCKVDGKYWLHLVSAIGSDGRYQISNNKNHVNGWCNRKNLYGIVVLIEPLFKPTQGSKNIRFKLLMVVNRQLI